MKASIAECRLLSEHKKGIIIRILFHPQIISRWINDEEMKTSFHSLLQNMSFDKEETLHPIYNFIRLRKDRRTIDNLMEILSSITQKQLNRGIVNWSSVVILLECCSYSESLKLMERIEGI